MQIFLKMVVKGGFHPQEEEKIEHQFFTPLQQLVIYM